MKQGFTLIEILIALVIASLLGMILFNTFFQSNRSIQIVDSVIDLNMRAVVLGNQLEKDISGAFVPRGKKKKKESEEKSEQKEKEKKKEEKQKPLKKIFYATQKNDMLDMLTFITSNSLSTYCSDQIGSARPKIARIMYKIEEDDDSEPANKSYRLMRKESPYLDFDKAEKDKKNYAYELAAGIKDLKLEYIAVETEKDTEDEKAKPKKSLKKSKTRDKEKEEDTGKDEEKKKKKIKRTPDYVRITLSLWGNQKKSDETFTFVIQIFAQPVPPKKKKKAQPKKEQQKPQTPSQPSGKPPAGQEEGALDFALSLIQGPKQ